MGKKEEAVILVPGIHPQGAGLSEVLRPSCQSDTGKKKANGRGEEPLQGTETQLKLA